jgi:enoyl-CoA hydratase/carnithine racemase
MIERQLPNLRLRTLAEGVVEVELHRPERRNAMNPAMVNELIYALDDCADDPAVRAIVLTGAGEHFCAGGDLGGMGDADDTLPVRGDFSDLLLRFAAYPKPTIAKVRGAAMGGALGLVASVDFALAASDATFATPEIKRGLFPFMILAPLSRVVPRRALLEMMLLGEKFSASRAMELSIVSSVHPAEELDGSALSLASRLAGQSPTAMRRGLLAFRRWSEADLAASLPTLRDELLAILGTDDAREGLAAFAEKRAPKWTGH